MNIITVENLILLKSVTSNFPLHIIFYINLTTIAVFALCIGQKGAMLVRETLVITVKEGCSA